MIVKNKRTVRILVENNSNIFNPPFNILNIFIVLVGERDDFKKICIKKFHI